MSSEEYNEQQQKQTKERVVMYQGRANTSSSCQKTQREAKRELADAYLRLLRRLGQSRAMIALSQSQRDF